MEYTLFFFIINFILISRLRLTFRDRGAAYGDVIKMALVPLLMLPFLRFNTGWIILLLYLTAYPFTVWKLEKNGNRLSYYRSMMLLMHILVAGLFASPVLSVEFHSYAREWTEIVRRFFASDTGPQSISLLQAEVMTFGLLMILNESNILIRLLLNIFNLEPHVESGQNVDEGEYNTGRVIGLLERIFIFVFVLLGQYTALGFILAAKGVTRFKDFESRTFAEYVLIGTLISTLFAMVWAWLVMLFL